MSADDTLVSLYFSYNVLDRMERWDSHTKEIVRKRLGPFAEPKVLSDRQAGSLARIARHITYDDREDVFAWIVHWVDERLSSNAGENQRELGVKPQSQLILEGLNALEHLAKIQYKKCFTELTEQQQFELISRLQKGQNPEIPEWQQIPQRKLFKKLAALIAEAYYSHPVIWSEIGYGGPVYPDVYVRVELGLLEPWEAKQVGE